MIEKSKYIQMSPRFDSIKNNAPRIENERMHD